MKNFISKTSIFGIVFISLLISVNYFGDAANLYSSDYENKIAEIIFTGKHATNISDYDERILQKELVQRLNKSPEVLILGSSRTMLINSTYFFEDKVINNSVSGASIEDLIAVYQLYRNQQILPSKIILGIDPWLFNVNNELSRWKSLSQEYYSFSNKKIEFDKIILSEKLQQLISLSYFQASFSNLINSIFRDNAPISTDIVRNKSNTKLVDGSLTYGKEYRETSEMDVDNKAKEYASKVIYSLGNYQEISPEKLNEFKMFITSILDNNIELSFFLVPYHPIVFKCIEQDYRVVLDVESEILNYAKEKNIECLGSFSPDVVGVINKGFYDGMHCKEETIKKILKVSIVKDEFRPLSNW